MILKVKFVQPAIVDQVKAGKEKALLHKDYTSTAIGQVIAQNDFIVCLALVTSVWDHHEIICIPQKSILECEVLDG